MMICIMQTLNLLFLGHKIFAYSKAGAIPDDNACFTLVPQFNILYDLMLMA